MTRSFHLAACLICLLCCAGVGSRCAAAAAPTQLVLWNVPEKPPSNAPSAAAVKGMDLFLAQYPEITIKRGGGPQLQRFGRGTREFLMAQAGGIAPDVIQMSAVDLQDFMNRSFLLPLDDYLREAGMWEAVVNGPFKRHISTDGHVYALPAGNKPMSLMLAYRRDVFEQVGLDPDRPPRTWDDLVEYARILADPPNNRTGFVLPSLETKGPLGAGGFVELLMALNGVEIIRKTEDGEWVADFADDPRALQALELLQTLIGERITRDGKEYRGIAATSAGRVDDAIVYAVGDAGMLFQGMDEVCWHGNRGTAKSDIGTISLPLGPSGDGFVPLLPPGRIYLGINSTCPSQARRDAAWKWIEFGLRPDIVRLSAAAYVDWGWGDYIDPRDAAGDPELASFASEIPAQWSETWRTHADNARALPLCPQHRQLRQDYLARPFWVLLKAPDRDLQALLRETEAVINKEVFSAIPVKVQTQRRHVAVAVVVCIVVLITAALIINLRGMAQTLSADRARGTIFQAGRRRIYLLAALFMLPAVGSVILWMYLPLIRGAVIAFQNYQIVGTTRWVGLDNFIAVLTDRRFWISLLRTVQYGTISLSLGFLAPIALAFFLSEVPRGKILFRVLFYLPALTSGLVIMFLWKWMYDPSPRGLLNTLIAGLGGLFGLEWGPFKWLDSERLAMISVILPSVWAGIGPGSIIYLAALHGVPEDLYEAADLDGGGVLSKIWHVSIPFLKPLIIINFVGAFIATFHTMQNIFVMTQGGPGDATYVVGLYIFFNSFVWLNFGKATAAAWILGSLLVGFTVYQLRIIRHLKFQAAASSEE